jgi:hypothetical protein
MILLHTIIYLNQNQIILLTIDNNLKQSTCTTYSIFVYITEMILVQILKSVEKFIVIVLLVSAITLNNLAKSFSSFTRNLQETHHGNEVLERFQRLKSISERINGFIGSTVFCYSIQTIFFYSLNLEKFLKPGDFSIFFVFNAIFDVAFVLYCVKILKSVNEFRSLVTIWQFKIDF